MARNFGNKRNKKKYNYEKIKAQNVGKSNEKNNQNIFVIEKDVMRTTFIKNNKEHFDKIKNILICFVAIFPEIGYCWLFYISY